MTDERATIVAATLAEHVRDPSDDHCSCCRDTCCADGSTGTILCTPDHQAEAVLAALDADPRVAVVDGADLRVLLDETAGVVRGYDEGYEAWCRLADANGRPE